MRGMESELSEYGLFDGLFFIASFHHLASREERISVLLQAKKLLSPTGKIAMINWNLLDPTQLKYQDSQTQKYSDGSADYSIKIGEHMRYYHAFSAEEYSALAEVVGLSLSQHFGERNSVVIFR